MSETAPPAVTPAPTEPLASAQSEHSKFVQHLATYPALSALAGLIASFPVAKIFVSNAVPLLHAIHERSRLVTDPIAGTASPYLMKLDDAGDQLLTKIDTRFPQLHTVQPSDVYEDCHNYVDSVKSNAFAMYETKVAQPLSHATSAARHQIDTAVPKLQDLYATKLQEQASAEPGYIAKLLAALATGKFLSIEGYHAALQHFGTPEKLQEAVGLVKEKVSATQAAAQQVVDDASQEVNQVVSEATN